MIALERPSQFVGILSADFDFVYPYREFDRLQLDSMKYLLAASSESMLNVLVISTMKLQSPIRCLQTPYSCFWV